MIHRRDFIIAIGATSFVAACQSGPPKPSTVTLNFSGQAGMNAGPGGEARPVTVMIFKLKNTGAFNSADYFALQGNAAGALGGDLVGSEQVSVAPGGTASKTITVEPEATSLGFVALLRAPEGKTWRTTKGVSPGSTVTINVTLGSGGISA